MKDALEKFNTSKYLEPIILVTIIILVIIGFVLLGGVSAFVSAEWIVSFFLLVLVIVQLTTIVFLNRIYESLKEEK